ncbi:unnamed protein product, partial [Didymodactylos carnosus]
WWPIIIIFDFYRILHDIDMLNSQTMVIYNILPLLSKTASTSTTHATSFEILTNDDNNANKNHTMNISNVHSTFQVHNELPLKWPHVETLLSRLSLNRDHNAAPESTAVISDDTIFDNDQIKQLLSLISQCQIYFKHWYILLLFSIIKITWLLALCMFVLGAIIEQNTLMIPFLYIIMINYTIRGLTVIGCLVSIPYDFAFVTSSPYDPRMPKAFVDWNKPILCVLNIRQTTAILIL